MQLYDFAAIFDLDGLLADTEPIWSDSARVLLSRRGKAYDPSLKPMLLGRHPVEVAGIMVRHYGLSDEPEALVAERVEILRGLYRDGGVPLLPGALDLVRAVAAADIARAVASGSPRSLVDTVLQHTGLVDSFPVCLGSDQVARGKPAPDLFLEAARRLAVDPSRCVVLEDAGAGVEAALAAGMVCVAVPDDGTPRSDLAGARLVVRSLAELTVDRLASLVQRT